MIPKAAKHHQKHTQLTRLTGLFHACELAVLGTTCANIKALAIEIARGIGQYKIGYADADHKSVSGSELEVGLAAAVCYTDKISFSRVDKSAHPNLFEQRRLFDSCDMVMVNGNHFSASAQILVIDEAKPIDKKMHLLTNVMLVLVKDNKAGLPDSLVAQLPAIREVPIIEYGNTAAIVNFLALYIQKHIAPLWALVLSGGLSTRMGQDKSQINYHGRPQREHVYNLLSEYTDQVFISCNQDQVADMQTLPYIRDTFLELGPLGGILSAFRHNPQTAWLTVACDMPFLSPTTLQHLVHHRNPSKLATTYQSTEAGMPEPLITIWEPRAYPYLLQMLAQGYSCPRKSLLNADVEIITAPLDPFAFRNVNTTDEYQNVIEILKDKHNS